jgi:hypothetical protein
LLAIGTFGNKQVEEVPQVQNSSEDVQPMQDAVKFTEEEVDRIQKEFAMILASKDQTEAYDSHDENVYEKQMDQSTNKKIIRSRSKDSLQKKGKTLKPKSVAALLKLLVCKGGFATAVPDPRNSFPQSRMEKVRLLTFICKYLADYTFSNCILYVILFSISASQGNTTDENTPTKFFTTTT